MSFALELELDRLDAEIAGALPGYVRDLADAYVAGSAAPFAPRVVRMRSTHATAMRALADPALASRALPLLRLLTPVRIEDDVAVTAARAVEPSWAAYASLRASRDAASTAAFHRPLVGWMEWLHGVGRMVPALREWPGETAGWRAPSPVPFAAVERAWQQLASRHGARGTCRIVHAATRPRAFIVEPGREVTVVVGDLGTPALRFAALHELGHALAALLSPVALPRVLDEAAASYAARLLEVEGALEPEWFTPVAAPQRAVRLAMVTALHAAELGARPHIARPPWGLWHDPGAQGAYAKAEQFADHWWHALGPTPPPGAFAAELAKQLAHVERAILADRECARALAPLS